jgi:hypothetical protein
MLTKFAFKLNQITDLGVMYDESLLEPLTKFVDDSGMIFMYNGSSNILDYTKEDFIGVVSKVTVENDLINLDFTVMVDRFKSLGNVPILLSMPLIDAEVVDSVVKVNKVLAIIVML